MHTATSTVSRLLPFATEASWATGRWAALQKYTSMATQDSGDDFNICVGRALLALQQHKGDTQQFQTIVGSTRKHIATSLSAPMTVSLASSHDTMLKLHVLTEMEMIAGTDSNMQTDRSKILDSLNRRLEVMGAYLNNKQYLLGIRRATMKLSR
jgi:serine/threonine-protein kinase ATR